MGVWEKSVFGNDVTCDVRDTYLFFLNAQQCTCEEAYKKTYDALIELSTGQEEFLFWLALAATQWECGELLPVVKNKALYWIEHSRSTDAEWKKSLMELQRTLLNSPPSRWEMVQCEFEKNLWQIGDVYAYRFSKKKSKELDLLDKYILVQKIGEDDSYISTYPRIQIYSKVFDTLPETIDFSVLDVLPLGDAVSYSQTPVEDRTPLPMNIVMLRENETDYQSGDFIYIGNFKVGFNYPVSKFNLSNCYWYELEDLICEFIKTWDEYDYSFCGDSVVITKSQ